jgi:hypothetical protein
LDYITDGVAAGAFSSDIDNQSAGNYQYDGNGNVTAAMGDSLGFVIFDINNQPSAAYKLNGTSVQFKYDANGMRVQKIQGAATTSYILGPGEIPRQSSWALPRSPTISGLARRMWGREREAGAHSVGITI